MSKQDDCAAATHDEICDGALRHYEEISTKACEWCSTVVHAIEFYRDNKEQITALQAANKKLVEEKRKVELAKSNVLTQLLNSENREGELRERVRALEEDKAALERELDRARGKGGSDGQGYC